MMTVSHNIKSVREKIAHAAKRAGRNPKDIKIVIAGKYADTKSTLAVIKAGATIIGENREQDLKHKFSRIRHKAQWHFIGHLQRNKVKSVIKIVSMIHSLDRFSLAEELEKQLKSTHKKLQALIEVNTSGEKSKFGVLPNEAIDLSIKCSQFKQLKIVGLMTMGALVKDPEKNRDDFKSLHHLLQKIRSQHFRGANKYKHLSMGTSQDYVVAVEEGATFVRIGRAIFQGT